MITKHFYLDDSRLLGQHGSISPGGQPIFNCSLEHNRTTNCSILKRFDILDGGSPEEGCLDSSGIPERVSRFLSENLFDAFSYLPSSDLKSLILGSDQYLQKCYKASGDGLGSSVKLFHLVDIPLVRNPESVIPVQTFSILFKFAKKNLNQLRSFLGNLDSGHFGFDIHDSMPSNDMYFYKLRQSISDFLGFLKRFIYIICSSSSASAHQSLNLFQLCASILKELKNLLIFSGRLSQFRRFFWLRRRGSTNVESPFQHLSDQKTALYNYYHSVLEIWWSTVEITYLMQVGVTSRYSFNDIYLIKEEPTSMAASKITGHPMFTQSIHILLYDLLLLGSRSHFEKNFTPGSDYHYQTPFICTCSWEVIVALRMLITHGITTSDSMMDSQEVPKITLDPFYDFLFAILSLFEGSKESSQVKSKSRKKYTEDDVLREPEMYFEHFDSIANPKLVITNPTYYRLYQVWIFSNLAPLLPLDLTFSNRLQVSSHKVTQPALLIRLFRLTLKECESTSSTQFNLTHESIVHNLLILTLKNSQFLSSPNFDLLILFVDHFLKKLNANYSIYRSGSSGSTSIQEYSWMPRNSARWFKAVEQVPGVGAEIGVNNFKLFLCLLADQLQRLFSSGSDDSKSQNVNFQKLISKIVVALQPRTLKQLDPMGVFNLGTFYLTIVASVPAERWADMADKMLFVVYEIAKNVCVDSKPNGSIVELLMQFHFALIRQKKCSETVTGKVVAQLVKLFEKFQLELFKCNLKQYHSLVRLYFEELESLLGLIKAAKCRNIQLKLFESLLLNLDLIQMQRNIRSSRRSTEIRQPRIVESLSEILQFVIKSIQEDGRNFEAIDVDDLLMPSMDCQETISFDRSSQNETVEFANKLNEKLKELVKTELAPFAEETDEEVVATVVFNVTLLTLLIENQSVHNDQPLLVTIKFFLHLSEKPHSAFQINYLYLLFEDYQIISKLKEEEYSAEILSSDMAVLLLSTWCRLLPVGITAFSEKMSSISRNLFRNLIAICDGSPTAPQINSDEDTIVFYRLLLRQLQSKHSRLGSYQEKSSHAALVSRYFGPLIAECRALFASVTSKSNAVTANVRQLKTVYWLVSYLVHFCASQMYTVGKADCLLAIICEHLLVVPNAALVDASDSTLSKCFPLIFEGFCQLNADPYLERKSRLLIVFYLPYILRGNTFDQIKHLFTAKNLYDRWKAHLYSAIEKVYLLQRNQVMSKQVYDYLTHFCTSELNDGQLMQLSRGLNGGLTLGDFNVKDYRVMLWQLVVCKSVERFDTKPDLVKQYIDTVLIVFVRANLQSRPVKCFEVLKSLLPRGVHRTCSLLFHELCGELHRLLDEVERVSLSGNNMVLRKLLKDFITSYMQST